MFDSRPIHPTRAVSDDPGPAPAAEGRLHRTVSLAEAVVSEGVTHWEDSDLLASFTEVELARRTLDATAAHLAHELERRGATHASEGLGTSGWIAWQHCLPRRDAGALVRVGSFLAAHPLLEQALRAGDLALAHIQLLARACTPGSPQWSGSSSSS